jgi:hypothetical protein
LLEKIVDLGKTLLIIADTVENEALTALVLNHKQGVLKTAAIKSPGFREQKGQTLQDVALLTGATFISRRATASTKLWCNIWDPQKRSSSLWSNAALSDNSSQSNSLFCCINFKLPIK